MLAGWNFAGKSFEYIKFNKRLLFFVIFIILSSMVIPLIFGTAVGIGFGQGADYSLENFKTLIERSGDTEELIVSISYIVTNSLLVTFFLSWVSYYVWDGLQNKKKSLGRAFVGAGEAIVSIFFWVLFGTAINIVLPLCIAPLSELLGRFLIPVLVLAALFALGVGALAIPIVAIERGNPIAVLIKSIIAFIRCFGDILFGAARFLLKAFLLTFFIFIFLYYRPGASLVTILSILYLFCVLIYFVTAQWIFFTFIYYYHRKSRGLDVVKMIGLEREILEAW